MGGRSCFGNDFFRLNIFEFCGWKFFSTATQTTYFNCAGVVTTAAWVYLKPMEGTKPREVLDTGSRQLLSSQTAVLRIMSLPSCSNTCPNLFITWLDMCNKSLVLNCVEGGGDCEHQWDAFQFRLSLRVGVMNRRAFCAIEGISDSPCKTRKGSFCWKLQRDILISSTAFKGPGWLNISRRGDIRECSVLLIVDVQNYVGAIKSPESRNFAWILCTT